MPGFSAKYVKAEENYRRMLYQQLRLQQLRLKVDLRANLAPSFFGDPLVNANVARRKRWIACPCISV